MNDVFEAIDVALRSRYLLLEDLKKVPLWNILPNELQTELTTLLDNGTSLRSVIPTIWRVRGAIFGKPVSQDSSQEFVSMMLGFLYLAFQKGNLSSSELLCRASHIIDSYVCEIDIVPFNKCRKTHGLIPPDDFTANLNYLFEPYIPAASECIIKWGLQ